MADARLGRDDGRPELAIRVDREKAALLGVSATTVANTIRTNIAGTQAAMYRQAGNEYPIIVRLREEERQGITDVDDVLIGIGNGQVMPAKNLMLVENAVGPTQIQRKNQQRITYVSAEPETTLSEAVAAVEERLPQLHGMMSQDFSVGFGAEVEQQAKAFEQLRMVLILALVLVYAVMASQYESLKDPFIIMFSVPTAAIGVVLSLKLTGTSFNMQAYIGIIMLAGIVVSNGILLVDYTNVLRRRDKLPLRRGRGARRPDAAAADSDDLHCDGARPGADVARDRRRQRAAGAARTRGHRRVDDVAPDHPGAGAHGLHAVRRGMARAVDEAP